MKGHVHRRGRPASPGRWRPYRRLVAVVLLGVAGYVLFSRARAPAPGLHHPEGATAPPFSPMPQTNGIAPRPPLPPLPGGRVTGGPFPPGPRGTSPVPPGLLRGG